MKKAKGEREAWNKLKEYHQRSTLSNKVRILKRLYKYQLQRGESMSVHLDKIFEDLDELVEMDAALDDKTAVLVILASLNEEYDGLITALEAWDEDKLTIQAVKIKLLEEYARKTVLHGHFKRDCTKYTNWKNKGGSAKLARFQEWYVLVWTMLCRFWNIVKETKYYGMKSVKGSNHFKHEWCIDSGATKHVCNDKDLFTEFKERIGKVCIAVGSYVNVKGE